MNQSALTCTLNITRGTFQLQIDCQFTEPITGIFGPSGSGKSTLLQVIAGLLRPNNGLIQFGQQILFDHNKNTHVPTQQRRIGFVFQEGLLFPHMNGEANLRYGERLLEPSQRRVQFQPVIDLLRLQPLLTRKLATLSGGERQRLALGRALLASPHLLLLDEPLNAVDRLHRADILAGLKTIRDEFEIPMLYVSHDLGEIMHLTQQIAVLDNGKIVGQGQFADLMRQESSASLLVDPLVQAHLH